MDLRSLLALVMGGRRGVVAAVEIGFEDAERVDELL